MTPTEGDGVGGMDEEVMAGEGLLEERVPRRGRRGWGVILAWTVVLGLLAIFGVSLLRSQQGPVGVGSKAPEFTLTTFEGDQISLADLQGKAVVINFWASWCTPCEQEAAELEQAYQLMKDRGAVFVGVNYVDTEPEALRYLDRFGITYPNGPDLGTRISQAYRIRGVPETFIVDPRGRVTSFQKGPYLSLSEITAAVEAALEE
jgi:cytochrome c biogenesis protein CcmG/thiol:disulfide interchange protein DsbE